jgi:DNA-binding transcriptional MerR regulator
MAKSPDAFRTISEVAEWLGVQAHVLRFWESKFSQVKPVKRAGGRRYYRPSDMLLLGGIKKLLHDDGVTIKGVQKIIREQGVGFVSDQSASLDDLTMAQLDNEAPVRDVTDATPRSAPQAKDDTSTVVPFQSPSDTAKKDAQSDDSGTDAVQKTPEPETDQPGLVADTPDTETPAETPADKPAYPIAEPPAQAPVAKPPESLPSFMQKPGPTGPTESPKPKPRIVEALDGPDEQDIEAVPGVLAKAAKLHRLRPSDLSAARQSYARLESLHARLTGTSKE